MNEGKDIVNSMIALTTVVVGYVQNRNATIVLLH